MKIIVTEKFGPDGVLQERVSEYVVEQENRQPKSPSSRTKINRKLNLYFKDEQEIRLKQHPDIIGKYDEQRNQITYNGKYFKSLNDFRKVKENQKVNVNAWTTCECKQDNGTWILCGNLPTIGY